MQQKHPNVTNQVKTQQQNLAIHGERKALAYGQPNFRPEPVPIHQWVNQRGEQNRQHLKEKLISYTQNPINT